MELAGRADPALDRRSRRARRRDVVVDFTTPDGGAGNVRECLAAGVHAVVGTSGFELDALASEAEAAAGDGKGATCSWRRTSRSGRC